jgi:hypothetical protein
LPSIEEVTWGGGGGEVGGTAVADTVKFETTLAVRGSPEIFFYFFNWRESTGGYGQGRASIEGGNNLPEERLDK